MGHVESHFIPFGDSVSVGAWFALDVPLAYKSFWMHPMELLGDVGHVESRFSPFRDSVIDGARRVHGLRQTCHRLKYQFGLTQWCS